MAVDEHSQLTGWPTASETEVRHLPSRTEFLDLLELEIADARSAGEAGGWTQWALAAALATVLAVLASTWESGKVDVPAASVVFVIVALIYGMFRDLRRLGTHSPPPPLDVRFYVPHYFSDQRGEQLALSCLWLVAIAAVWYLGDRGADRPYRAAAYLYFAPYPILAALLFIMSWSSLDFPLQHPSEPFSGLRKAVVASLQWIVRLIALAAIFGFSRKLQFVQSGKPLRDTRAGVLAAIALVLAVELADRRTRHASLVAGLSGIRRDLILGNCDLGAAVTRFEEKTLGILATRILEGDIAAASTEYDQAEAAFTFIEAAIARVDREVDALAETAVGSPEEIAQLATCVQIITPVLDQMKQGKEDFDRHMREARRHGNRAYFRGGIGLRSEPRAGPALAASLRPLDQRGEILGQRATAHFQRLDDHTAHVKVLRSRAEALLKTSREKATDA
jgi:hypothetical protein